MAVADAKKKKIDMPDFEAFWKNGEAIEFKVDDKAKKWVRHAAYREDPAIEPLGTPSGKIEIFSKAIEDMKYDGIAGHPVWTAPREWLGAADKTAK